MASKTTRAKPNLRVVGGKSGGDSGDTPPPNPRHFSVNALSKILGRDRGTIMRWIDSGCPVAQRADKATGADWLLDISEVVKWLEAQAAAKAKAASARTADRDDEQDGDTADLLSLAHKQLRFDADRKKLVTHEHSTAKLERHHGILRQNVKALPLRLMDLMPGIDADEYARLYPLFVDVCFDCLRDAAKEIGIDPDTGLMNGPPPSA